MGMQAQFILENPRFFNQQLKFDKLAVDTTFSFHQAYSVL